MKPIELVSGDDIVKLMEEKRLGLKQVFQMDDQFIQEFEGSPRSDGRSN
jgi:hypothetical protein